MYSWATYNPYPGSELGVKIDFLEVDPSSVEKIVSFCPQAVISSTGAYTGDGAQLSIINISAALTLAHIVRQCGTPALINLSSLSVYGWPLPKDIDSAMPNPSDDYGRSKYLQEVIFLGLSNKTNGIFNIRLPVVLGRGAHRAWLPTVKDLMIRGEDIRYSNPYDNYTCFTTIHALCSFVTFILRSKLNEYCSFPIGGASKLTVTEMLMMLRNTLNSPSCLIEESARTPMSFIYSTKAISIGYEPPDIYQAIEEFV
jgi:nucleoside-diphosphate-sugar epimerase